jgi:hypothetical protein
MTDEQDREPLDKLVSETYRELPTPRAPDHLNQTILRMAKKKGPGRADSLFATWMKPVTLAATIALSLAIVLELSEVPVKSESIEVVPAGREERAPHETDSLVPAADRARSQFERIPAPVRADESTSTDAGLIEELVLEETDLVKREAKDKIESFAASPPAPVLPAARKRAADMPDSNQPAAMSTSGLAMERNDSDDAAACDKKARQSADSWLDCIDQLRESGATLDADREYEAFMLEYPTGSADPDSNK